MGLLSSMKKMTNWTKDLLNTVNGAQLGTNIPSNSITRALGFDDGIPLQNLGDIKSALDQIHQGIATPFTIMTCAYTLSKEGGWGTFGRNVLRGLAGVIESITEEVFDAISTQFANACRHLLGTVTSLIDALTNLIQSVLLIADAI